MKMAAFCEKYIVEEVDSCSGLVRHTRTKHRLTLWDRRAALHSADGRTYGASHSSAYISDELVCRDITGSSSGLRANPVGSRSLSVVTFWGLRSLMPILK